MTSRMKNHKMSAQKKRRSFPYHHNHCWYHWMEGTYGYLCNTFISELYACRSFACRLEQGTVMFKPQMWIGSSLFLITYTGNAQKLLDLGHNVSGDDYWSSQRRAYSLMALRSFLVHNCAEAVGFGSESKRCQTDWITWFCLERWVS